MSYGKLKIIKGFNLLRFIAAFGVLIHHLELYKNRIGFSSLYNTFFNNLISHLGENMVYLFFVLSGFLITYLLLIELQKTNTINVRKFYIRRILRIWPLYYLIMLISFFILPYIVIGNVFFYTESFYYNTIINTDYGGAFLFFLFFLSNLALIFGYKIVGASQSWSVSVEEQFYAFWPWFVKFFHKKMPLFLLIFIFFKIGVTKMGAGIENEYVKNIFVFMNVFPIEYMAIGALAGYYSFKMNVLYIKVFRNKIIIVTVLFSLFIFLFIGTGIILPILFGMLLSIIFVNQEKIKESKISNLGIISYGIYMYHPLVMFVVFACLNKFIVYKEGMIIFNVLLYMLTISFTLLISHLSFKYYESFFLNKKHKFSVVKTNSKF